LHAALPHVVFLGWSEATFTAAVAETQMDPALARGLYPRGGLDLLVAFHQHGDRQMQQRLAAQQLDSMRFRDRVAHALWLRLEIFENREYVRRGMCLLSLPPYAALGSRLVWGTASAIWDALGDRSDDVNWYTKRATLSAVYAATVVFWLGDNSEGCSETRAFLDRRIEGVMRIGATRARFEKSLAGRAMAGPLSVLLRRVRAPQAGSDFPGRWRFGR